MLRFFKHNDKELFRWCGVIQSSVIKPLYSKCDFTQNDINSLVQFCFPIGQPISGPLFFIFRFRPSNGKFYNVFCLLDQTSFNLKDMDMNQQSVICIITEFYHAEVYEEILKAVRSLLLHSISTTERFLKAIINSPESITNIPCLTELYRYHSITDYDNLDFNYRNYVSNDLFLKPIVKLAVDLLPSAKIGRVIIALLTDTPIIVISSDLSKLSRFCYSIIGLIYPLSWHHIFAPVLPVDFIDSVSSPAPFIVGLHRALVRRAMNCDIEGHLLIDIDEPNGCTFTERNLPPISPYATQLISRLQKNAKNPHNNNYPLISGNISSGGINSQMTLPDLRNFILLIVCACLGTQPSNNRSATVKRILNSLENSKLDTNSFACSLLQSRTMRSFFDALRERTLPQEFASMISLGYMCNITSLAIQNVDEFPLKRKNSSIPHSSSLAPLSGGKKKINSEAKSKKGKTIPNSNSLPSVNST